MRIMMLGDVYSRPGRTVLKEHLEELIREYRVDFTVVNAENASGGNGITEKNLKELMTLPIDAFTMGNHVWQQRETENFIDNYPNMVRPANYPEPCPGKGYTTIKKNGVTIGIINLSGLVYMPQMGTCPFATFDQIYDKSAKDAHILLVDFHGEATSEKIAFGYFADGRASVVVGTHTHVQTADARVLPGGTAHITDLGMTGALNSVIGVKKEIIVQSMVTKRPVHFEAELEKPWQINGIVVDVDKTTGKAASIERIYRVFE